LLQLWLLS